MLERIRRGGCVLALLALVTACGNDGSGGDGSPTPTPTPIPTATARPTPGCGNGLVDPGEFCDGEDFCTDCGFVASFCCELADVDGGTACGVTGFSPQACVTVGSGRFVPGSTCEGSSCNPDAGLCRHDGRCAIQAIEPVSVCCQSAGDGCTASIVSDTNALAELAFYGCDGTDTGRAVIGNCGADGRCVPPR